MEDMRIYVSSLSDYNNGRLEGKWLDLADYSDASELMEAIQEMLDELTKKYKSIDGEVREEWAVHDYEGIPSTLASEYMGEQDFQQLYDIAEVAEDRGIPVAVLVERAGDTGSDDYQALADSLMFVVDGNDESDIVHEYESQLGELGSDFWSNHIYVDDVTERVIYGEDVDRIREDILYENPDMDEDEAERQAEELADEEAERRADLTTYLEDMGYGDEIPSWVSKDYEGAWKRSLSYDLDVIHHDGEMYVFSNNYGIGGTILSGMVGAYIGYKIGRARPQKIGFGTEVRIGNSVKDSIKAKIAKRKASKKKKYATGGGIGFKGLSAKVAKRYEGKKPQAKYRGEYGKRYSKSEAKEVGDKVAGKVYWQQKGRKMAMGGGLAQYPNDLPKEEAERLFHLAHKNAKVGDRLWNNFKRTPLRLIYSQLNERGIKYEDGGRVGQEIVFDDNGEENTGVIKEIHEITGDYIVNSDDGRTLLAQRDRDVISLGKMRENRAEAPRKRFGFFEGGGGVDDKVDLKVKKSDYRDLESFLKKAGIQVKQRRNDTDINMSEYIIYTFFNNQDRQRAFKYVHELFSQGGGVSGLDDLIRG